MRGRVLPYKTGLRLLCTGLLWLLPGMHTWAQKQTQFRVRGNEMQILLPVNITLTDLNEFTCRYNVNGIGLHQLLMTKKDDSLKQLGWKLDAWSEPGVLKITKPMESAAVLRTKDGKTIFTAVPTDPSWRVVGGNRIIYGVNRFKERYEFTRERDTVYFRLKGYANARSVRLAGSFTNWQHGAFPMSRTSDGWVVPVKLEPGEYHYKFIIEENHWITDPANQLAEDDGYGNENSVYYVPNKKFQLSGFENAVNVFVAGSFNNWVPGQLRLQKAAGGWELEMYLQPGTHSYYFIVDGQTVQPGAGQSQAVTAIGEPHVFRLKGLQRARKVYVAGNFNDWNPAALEMKKTGEGWELPYVLGPGNYQYKFIVDGEWMTDPANPRTVNDGKGNINSFMVVGANHVFRLSGYEKARSVFLAGTFNDWSAEALPMERNNGVWECRVFLAKGKHLYKFVVDGQWIRDPANDTWEENEFHTGNSVIWVK